MKSKVPRSQKLAAAREELFYSEHHAQEFQNKHVHKCRRRYTGVLKLLALVCAMVCGVYACSAFLKQSHNQKKSLRFEFQVTRCNDVTDRSRFIYSQNAKSITFNRLDCARNPKRLFVILSMQRSGSGWFETLMNNHTYIRSNGEIFGEKSRRQNVSSIINTLDRVYNLDLITSSSKNECSSAVGFKWMLNQGLMEYPKEILDYFIKRDVYIIFFFRRNMLRRLVSILANSFDKEAKLLNGIHVSHVHSQEEALTLSSYKPTINVASLETDLSKMESRGTKALEYYNRTRHIVVYYEDLTKNPYKLVQVEDFLKLPRMKLSSKQVKIHKGPLSEHINNWDDVIRTLSGTSYERYLRADY